MRFTDLVSSKNSIINSKLAGNSERNALRMDEIPVAAFTAPISGNGGWLPAYRLPLNIPVVSLTVFFELFSVYHH